MNPLHKTILDFIQASENISEEERDLLVKSIKNAEKALVISEFKLERTEKVKRTTSILLEETIEELELKRKDVEKSNEALTRSLEELKAAQKQLIQAEKMASLGELTAGIAHEIQNPLNFVNNFSDVSKELLEEMMEELENDDIEEVKAIANDVIQNLEKILHHGKRADSIVKGMLQHSRKNDGVKEATDINALVDEYLRLAYHGLRAKDKTFNANIETNYDDRIGKIEIVPQDIGRVVLNLITNAFYATNEKSNLGEKGYEPMVTVSTKIRPLTPASGRNLHMNSSSDAQSKRLSPTGKGSHLNYSSNAKHKRLSHAGGGREVEISISDNGSGIPKIYLDKIFQPFFTTKPTGQGTGLGLSLSYDIIKAHNGELKVKTELGEGTEFIILLPLTN